MSTTVFDRIIQYHPEMASLLTSEHKSLIESAFDFFQTRECRPGDRLSHTHVNYGGVARSWYSSISGRFNIAPDALVELYMYVVKLWQLGLPLQLVECRERLSVFPLYLDIDVKMPPGMAESDCLAFEQTEFFDKDYRIFRLISRLLHHVYPTEAEKTLSIAVFSATRRMGSTAPATAPKVSLRLVFPNLIVDKDRAVLLREFLVDKLNYLSRDENTSTMVRSLKSKLIKMNPNNHFRNVIDETAIRCRHGLRMLFNEKTVNGVPVGRVFVPVVLVEPVLTELKKDRIESIKSVKKYAENESIDAMVEWIRIGSLATPTLSHQCELTQWREAPVVRPSRTTRTGPGGSSLALSNFTTNDAVRAANRFREEKAAPSLTCTAQFEWPEGSIPLFKRRIPIGLDGDTEILSDTITWKLTKKRTNWISFEESKKIITVSAPSSDALKQLIRIVEKFPNVTIVKTSVPQATLPPRPAAPQITTPTRKTILRVLKSLVGEGEGELTCEQNDELELVDPHLCDDPNEWIAVKTTSGLEGYVPRSYVQVVTL
jgi:hypothetical protein